MLQTDTESLKLKRIGTCSVSMRISSLTSSGTIHSHDHGSPCAGSGCPPVSLADSTLQLTVTHTLKSTTVDVIQSDSNNQLDSQALLDSVIKAICRVLKYIPKASRLQATAKLTEVLDYILADPDNVNFWQQFLLFTYSCFGVGERGGKRHNRSLATRVNHALSDFTSTSSCRSQPTVTIKKKSRLTTSTWQHVLAKIEAGDVRGAVRLAVNDDSLAPYSDLTVKALHKLHPPRSAPSINLQLLPEPDVAPAQVLFLCHSDITEAIKSFPAGSARGLDGLRPQHLKDMTSPYTGIIGQKLLSILVQFSNLCLAGRVPGKVRPVLYGASLCALAKKSGGVRPIAVGSTVRRLVAKAACRSVKDDVVIKLAPKQLGFGVRFGADTAAHAARSFLSNLERGQALLKIDFSNAFNTLRRDQMLYMVQNELSELYPFIYSRYSDQSFLRFGQYTLTSEESTQQGDPLGPLLYCCTTMSLVKRVKSVFNV
jgi:hypothetical protein